MRESFSKDCMDFPVQTEHMDSEKEEAGNWSTPGYARTCLTSQPLKSKWSLSTPIGAQEERWRIAQGRKNRKS